MSVDDAAPQRRNRGRPSIGFLTALVSDELRSAHHVLNARGWTPVPLVEQDNEIVRAGIAQWRKSIDGQEFDAYTMPMNDMGQARSAIETMAFVTLTKTTLNFLVGIAGSLDSKDVHREDVIIGTNVLWRHKNKVSDGDPCPKYRTVPARVPSYTVNLTRRLALFAERYANAERGNAECDIKHVGVGEIFTWDQVVNGESVVSDIKGWYPNAKCVEMEAGGFLCAIERYAQVTKWPSIGLVVRGISDYAEAKLDERNVRSKASANAANVAVDVAEWLVTSQEYALLRQDLWKP